MKSSCSVSLGLAVLTLPIAPVPYAQVGGESDTTFEMPTPIKDLGQAQVEAGEFTFVRIKYSSDESFTQFWSTDYPIAEYHFLRQFAGITRVPVRPDGVILELTDSTLAQYPFIYIVEGGQLRLDDAEVVALREYLLGGGFLMVDDFWGDAEWASLAAEMRRVFPDREPVELWPHHEIFHSFYGIGEKPRVPGVAQLDSGSHRGVAIDEADIRGFVDDDGRLMAILCHNMDFGDAWEHLDDPLYPKEFSLGGGVMMGVNIVVYALAH
jgi:hypothetical protein